MNYRDELIKEHTSLLENIENLEIIPKDDPDLLRMDEIMEELRELDEID